MLSALSLVVDLTDVNNAINSSREPPAASNAPPVRRTAVIKSLDSTANLPATELIELNLSSN